MRSSTRLQHPGEGEHSADQAQQGLEVEHDDRHGPRVVRVLTLARQPCKSPYKM